MDDIIILHLLLSLSEGGKSEVTRVVLPVVNVPVGIYIMSDTKFDSCCAKSLLFSLSPLPHTPWHFLVQKGPSE